MLLPLHLNLAGAGGGGGGGHSEPPAIRTNLTHEIVHTYADPDMIDVTLVRALIFVLIFLTGA